MRLSLRGWPPIASHLACVIAGVSLAHLAANPPEPPLRLSTRAMFVTVATPKSNTLLPGTRIAAVRLKADGTQCRALRQELKLIRNASEQALIQLPHTAASEASQLLKDAKSKRLKLLPISAATDIKPCRPKSRIQYGS